MKIHRNLFYVCLTGIMIFYIMNLMDTMELFHFRFGLIALWGCFITNFILIINILTDSKVSLKELFIRLITMIIFLIITVFLKHYMSIYSTVLNIYLFDLGLLLAKIICKKIHLNMHISKYLFFALPLALIFRLPTYLNGENLIRVSAQETIFIVPFDTHLQLLLNVGLSVYLGIIITLSHKTSIYNLLACIIYLVIILICPHLIAPNSLNGTNLFLNIFTSIISFIFLYLYNVKVNKDNIHMVHD